MSTSPEHDAAVRIWNLPNERRPAELLRLQAALVSAGPEQAGPEISGAQSDPSRWALLRSKYTSAVTASTRELKLWHELEAEMAERNAQWFAAVFHLKRLSEAAEQDPTLRTR